MQAMRLASGDALQMCGLAWNLELAIRLSSASATDRGAWLYALAF